MIEQNLKQYEDVNEMKRKKLQEKEEERKKLEVLELEKI